MEFKDVIIEFIKNRATLDERLEIARVIDAMEEMPPISIQHLKSNIESLAINKYKETQSKLQTIKFIKDITGWGLKEAKEWCDVKLAPTMLIYASD